MRIGILMKFRTKKLTGVPRETIGVLSELKKMDKRNEYFYIGEELLPLELDTIPMPFSNWSNTPLDYTLMAYPLDIVHSHYAAYSLSKKNKCKKVITIHDLMHISHPEWFPSSTVEFFNGPLRKTAEDADRIIAVSESTKTEIINHYGIDGDKISVIYNGLYPKSTFCEQGCRPTNDRIVSGHYILSVSAVHIYKNQVRLMEAYIRFRDKYPDVNIKLVLVGPIQNKDGFDDLLNRYTEDIIYAGYVTDDELIWLYKNAFMFAYVSLYEGFGLPILEAMTGGKAVVCSNTTSMPEVGGDAVEYCNPYEVDSIETALEKVILDSFYRETLEKKAIEQSRRFSYDQTAIETLDLYTKLVGER